MMNLDSNNIAIYEEVELDQDHNYVLKKIKS